MLEELQNDNLKEIVDSNEKVIVQYGATWCGVCKVVKPQFSRLAGENENVKFYYVDAEKFPESRDLVEVNNLPTFAGFVNGKVVKSGMGSNAAVIQGILDEIANH